MSISSDPSAGFQASPIDNPKSMKPYDRWRTEIAYSESELKKFHERGRSVVKRFLDERDAIDSMSKWFNLFHTNTNIMKSALYAQLPKPVVSRRFKDYQDDVARVAATIMERCLKRDLDDPRDTFDAVMRAAVEDRLIPGLGTAWIRLETDTKNEPVNPATGTPQHETSLEITPEPGEGLGEGSEATPNHGFKTGSDPSSKPQTPPEMFTRITDQRVVVDYVYWEDFLWSPCRVWMERRWVGRRAHLTREELVRRFGEEKGGKVPLNYKPMNYLSYPSGSVPVHQAVSKATVYEIWDRDSRKVYWLSKDHPEILDEKDDPLKLIGFEPCPEPMWATMSTSNAVPRPDFYMVQDQYNELDTVNNRISMLVRACKVCGVYDRSSEGVQRMLQEGFDNTLIPVDNWAAFAEKGGVKGQVDWLPLEMVLTALEKLYTAREAIKNQIYELTGIADIIRGASKASETLGAQQIKAQFASVRIKTLQDQVAKFAAEILRIKAEITVKHFDPILLLKKSNILYIEPEQLVAQAIALLLSEEGFEWRIEVTADSMAQADYAMEKQDRVELLTSVSAFMEKAGMMIQQVPQATPLLVAMLKWTVAAFRNSSELETMLDQALDSLMQGGGEQEQKEDPEAAKAKAELEMRKEEHQMDMEGKKMDLQFKGQTKQMDMRAKQAQIVMEGQAQQQKLVFDTKKAELDFQKFVAQQAAAMVNPQGPAQ